MNLKRSLALTLSVLLILTAAIPVALGAGEPLERLKGANKWETAVKICQEGWESADAVVLASGEKFADALAGVPLAAALDAPILLTKADSLVEEAKDEIVRLGATEVYILGGTAAVSADVEEELEGMDLEVTRVKGNGRAETAVEISKLVAPDGSDTVVLVYAWDFPDALAAASYAAAAGYPILLTEKNSVPEATLTAIENLGADNIIVVGGTSVISEDAVEDLEGVERIKGANREETAVKLAEKFAPNATMFYIATGDGFADAIAGAALAAKNDTGILLVRKSLHSSVANFLNDNVFEAVVFGGTGAVGATVEAAVRAKMAVADTGVAGFITFASDGDLEDIVIKAGGKTGTIEDDGFYFIAGVPVGDQKVTVEVAGYEKYSADVSVANQEVSVHNVQLTKLDASGINITGTVVDATTNAPVAAKVTVKAYREIDDVWKWVEVTGTTGVTSTNGAFTINQTIADPDLEFGETVIVTVSKDLAIGNQTEVYKSQTFNVTLDNHAVANVVNGVKLVPVDTAVISGTIYLANGNKASLTDQVVDLYKGDTKVASTPTTTNTEGKFAFDEIALPSGTYTIQTTMAGHAAYVSNISVVEGVDLTHNIKLETGYTVTKFTLAADPLGEDLLVAGAAAVIKKGDTPIEGATGTPALVEATGSAATDVIEFTFDDVLKAGTYVIEVCGDFFQAKEFTVTVGKDSTTFTGRTKLAGAVDGSVTIPDGEDYEDIVVDILNAKDAVVATVEVDASGNYLFQGVPFGEDYSVRVSLDGYVSQTSPEFDVATTDVGTAIDADALVVDDKDTVETTDDELFGPVTLAEVSTQGTIKGYIREAGSLTPIDTDEAVYYTKDANGAWVYDTPVTIDVATDGLYSLTLEEGEYLVVIRFNGHETYSQVVKVVANKTTYNHVDLAVGGNATLRLDVEAGETAFDDSTTPTVTLTDAWTNADYGTIAYVADQETYNYQLGNLPAGTYTLKVEYTGFNPVTKTVVIGKGATVVEEVTMDATASTYDVNFTLYSGFNILGTSITGVIRYVDAAGEVQDLDITSGVASLPDDTGKLPAGTYVFTIYAEGYYAHTISVVIDDADVNVPVVEMWNYKW